MPPTTEEEEEQTGEVVLVTTSDASRGDGPPLFPAFGDVTTPDTRPEEDEDGEGDEEEREDEEMARTEPPLDDDGRDEEEDEEEEDDDEADCGAGVRGEVYQGAAVKQCAGRGVSSGRDRAVFYVTFTLIVLPAGLFYATLYATDARRPMMRECTHHELDGVCVQGAMVVEGGIVGAGHLHAVPGTLRLVTPVIAIWGENAVQKARRMQRWMIVNGVLLSLVCLVSCILVLL